MRIVSLNAWGGKVWPALRDWIAATAPDVLCLQEVTRALAPGPDWLVYRDAERTLDQRADLFADVSALLPSHQARFAAAARGVLQDARGRGHASEHGIAQWVAPGLAIAEQWQGFVHGDFRAGGWGEQPVSRTCQVTRLADAAGATLIVAHVHGLRDPEGKGDTPARRAQWQRLAHAVGTLHRPEEPAIVAGDMNVRPGSDLFATMRNLGLTDLVTGRGFADTRTSLYAKAERHANYMFVTPDLRVEDFAVPATPEVSDHRPLILTAVM